VAGTEGLLPLAVQLVPVVLPAAGTEGLLPLAVDTGAQSLLPVVAAGRAVKAHLLVEFEKAVPR